MRMNDKKYKVLEWEGIFKWLAQTSYFTVLGDCDQGAPMTKLRVELEMNKQQRGYSLT
jgi:hypothetical protein